MIYLRALGSYSVAASQINLYRAEQRKKPRKVTKNKENELRRNYAKPKALRRRENSLLVMYNGVCLHTNGRL